MTGIQIIGILFALAQCYFTFLNFKRGEFTILETISWIFVWLSFGLVTLFPGQFSLVAGDFGAMRAMDLFTVLGFLVVLSISFYNYVNVDRLRKKLEKAVRDLAINDLGSSSK